MPTIALVAAVVLAASFTQGVVGFGFGMVAMSLIPWLLGYRTAVALVAVFGLANNVSLLWRYRRDFSLRDASPLLLGGVLGAPLGAWLVVAVDPHLVMRFLGVVLVIYATERLLLRFIGRKETVSPARPFEPWGILMGLAGGFMGAAFNTGGPPAIVYGTVRRWPQGTFKAVLQGFFLLTCVLQLSLYASEGLLTPEVLRTNALLLPALALGLLTGARLSDRLDGETFRRLVLLSLLVLGVVYLVRA